MKTYFQFRKSFSSLFVVFASFLFFLAACSKENSNNNNNGNSDQSYTTQGNASGSQQNPPVLTSGNAKLVGTYNATTNNWEYSISWTSLTGAATLIEFHGPANVGANGEILFSLNITGGDTNGSASGTTKLSDEMENYLMNGQIYFTVLTTAHLTGEVRGQVYVLTR